jgi:hypothetical protein
LARIPADEEVGLLTLPERRSFFERLLEASEDDNVFAPTPSVHSWLASLKSLESNTVWTILPGVPEVQ